MGGEGCKQYLHLKIYNQAGGGVAMNHDFLTSVYLLYLNLHIIESKGIYCIVTTAHETPKTHQLR